MAQIDSLIKNRERIRRALLTDTGHADTASLGISRRDAEFIEKLNAHIEEHLCEETFYIEQLAEKMFMSRSNFYRKVKSLFGISPNDYMKTYRLRKAAEMIRSGDFPDQGDLRAGGIQDIELLLGLLPRGVRDDAQTV